jgi:hypothetical protein
MVVGAVGGGRDGRDVDGGPVADLVAVDPGALCGRARCGPTLTASSGT